MKKIKVLHIITKLELGGAQRNTLYTVKNLDRSCFEPLLVSGAGGILDEEAGSIADIKFISLASLVREISPAKDLAALLEIYRIIRREMPDIIHTHSSKAGILGRFAAAMYNFSQRNRRRKVKIVHTYHGFGFTPAQNPLIRSGFILLEKIAARFSDVLVFVSEANMREASRLRLCPPSGGARTLIIRSGVDVSFFKNFVLESGEADEVRKRYGVRPDEKVVLTIGPFKPQKNLGDFIRVAAEIKKRLISARFIIVGDGALSQELHRLADALGVKENVVFAGWITTKKELAQLLKISDVFLLTSLWEGLPRSLVEAISSGLAVCAGAVDGVTDIISDGETGLLHAPRDVSGASDNVEKILRDPSLARRLADAASKKIDEQFDINKMVRLQEDLYKEMVALPD